MTLPPLGKIRDIVTAATGLDITHVWEDLAFVDMGVYLIRFDLQDPKKFFVVFHEDCEPPARNELFEELRRVSLNQGLSCVPGGFYSYEPTENPEELRISFYEKSPKT